MTNQTLRDIEDNLADLESHLPDSEFFLHCDIRAVCEDSREMVREIRHLRSLLDSCHVSPHEYEEMRTRAAAFEAATWGLALLLVAVGLWALACMS